jgi:hypothetical protein
MASGPSENDRAIRLSTELFQRIELVVYVALGVLLSVAALLALGSAALLLWEGMRDWSGTSAIFLTVDRLMFVLMLNPRAILDRRAYRFDPKRSHYHPEVIRSDLGAPRVN